jgi:hypothetical protein
MFTRPLTVALLLIGVVGFAGPPLVAWLRGIAGRAAVPEVPR